MTSCEELVPEFVLNIGPDAEGAAALISGLAKTLSRDAGRDVAVSISASFENGVVGLVPGALPAPNIPLPNDPLFAPNAGCWLDWAG